MPRLPSRAKLGFNHGAECWREKYCVVAICKPVVSKQTRAGLSPGRPDEGVWAYVCTSFRALGFHPRSFCERFLGNRHRRPFSAQGLGQIRAKQP
jgi:hypothetical protein